MRVLENTFSEQCILTVEILIAAAAVAAASATAAVAAAEAQLKEEGLRSAGGGKNSSEKRPK